MNLSMLAVYNNTEVSQRDKSRVWSGGIAIMQEAIEKLDRVAKAIC